MIEFRVSAPGKLILYGEHAVVYGKTAVAASLDLRTTLDFKELSAENNEHLILSMPKTRLHVNVSLQQVRQYFDDNAPKFVDGHEIFHAYVQNFVETIGYANVQQKFGLEAVFYLLVSISQTRGIDLLRPFEIVIDSGLSISSGLGSSASFAVCLATAFIHWSNVEKNLTTNTTDPRQLDEISKYALNCEKIMHGTPSGVDNSVCTYGSIIEFRRGGAAAAECCLEPILGVKSMRVLLVDTRVQRSTKALVEKLGQLKRKYPSIVVPILESIDNVSKEALSVIKKIRDIPEASTDSLYTAYQELMVLIQVNQGLLATCQVSHPSLDRICAEAQNYGLAAKLTGAGGGGYAYILLLPDTPNETITSITKKLIANGYLVTLTNLGGSGVTIQHG